jgi:hypothetical protein
MTTTTPTRPRPASRRQKADAATENDRIGQLESEVAELRARLRTVSGPPAHTSALVSIDAIGPEFRRAAVDLLDRAVWISDDLAALRRDRDRLAAAAEVIANDTADVLAGSTEANEHGARRLADGRNLDDVVFDDTFEALGLSALWDLLHAAADTATDYRTTSDLYGPLAAARADVVAVVERLRARGS